MGCHGNRRSSILGAAVLLAWACLLTAPRATFGQATLGLAQQDDDLWQILLDVAELNWTPPTDAQLREQLVGQLVAVIEADDAAAAELAMRALTQLGESAAPAVDALCVQLNHQRYSTRAFAVAALVAIGNASVAPLRAHLRHDSLRVQAAAITALGRMQKLQLSDCEPFLSASDPRVCGALAGALGNMNAEAVPDLITLLNDAEPAVSVEAGRALAINRNNPELAVPALAKMIAKPDRATAIAESLARYGTEARSAVPALIRGPEGLPTEYSYDEYAYHDLGRNVLQHIGPPSASELPQLIPLLSHEDEEVQTLAAAAIGLMGLEGAPAADALEKTIDLIFERYAEELKNDPDDEDYNAASILYVQEMLATALWHVTRDTDRFLAAIDRIVEGGGVYSPTSGTYDPDPPWLQFADEDQLKLSPFLSGEDEAWRAVAQNAMRWIGLTGTWRLEDIKQFVAEAEAQEIHLASFLISKANREIANAVIPILLERYRSDELSAGEIATWARRLGLYTEELRQVYWEELNAARDGHAVRAGIEALVAHGDPDDERAAIKFMIELQSNSLMSHRSKADLLAKHTPTPELAIPYLEQCLTFSDIWTVHGAARALGAYGERAEQSVPKLTALLDAEHTEPRLQAGASIYQITGDTTPLAEELTELMAGDRFSQFPALRAITELGPAAVPFQHFVLDVLKDHDPVITDNLILTLAAIDSPETRAALEELAQGNDWAIQKLVQKARREQNESSAGGNE